LIEHKTIHVQEQNNINEIAKKNIKAENINKRSKTPGTSSYSTVRDPHNKKKADDIIHNLLKVL
jgi:hypothetical protein